MNRHNRHNPFEGNDPSLHGGIVTTVQLRSKLAVISFGHLDISVKIVHGFPFDHSNYSDLCNLHSSIAGHTLILGSCKNIQYVHTMLQSGPTIKIKYMCMSVCV